MQSKCNKKGSPLFSIFMCKLYMCVYIYIHIHIYTYVSQVVIVVKKPTCHTGDVRDAGLIPELGISPGGEHGYPLQYPCLENPMAR